MSANDELTGPKDNEEHRRLDLQHHIYTMMLGELYPAPDLVRWALRPRAECRPSVLDIGTGSGRWYVYDARGRESFCVTSKFVRTG